jgi:hypothetical protein
MIAAFSITPLGIGDSVGSSVAILRSTIDEARDLLL